MTRDGAIIEFAAGARFGGETIFDDLHFTVERGEFLCILGPSGCGKSTALRLIGGLIAPTLGEIRIGGSPADQAWRRLAFVFQAPRLVPWRSALDNVALALELRDPALPKREREHHARELLERVGLGADLEKLPRMLSGGERQRVAIARALAVEPEIILMDEPFSALDINTRRKLRHELIDLWRQTGKTIVFVTHDIDEALVLADRVLVFSGKPTRVLDVVALAIPRPRRIEEMPELMARRAQLHALFQALESPRGSAEEDRS